MALSGVRFRAYPTEEIATVLRQWQGCARFIWNAKCDEERYHRTFAKKFCPVGTYAPIDQITSHFKSKELSPWLYDVPSQILRNSASNWHKTFKKFMKGECGRPKPKGRSEYGSVHLTREIFRFKQNPKTGQLDLEIGTKKNPVGIIPLNYHRKFKIPASIYVRREHTRWFVGFNYENDAYRDVPKSIDHDNLTFLSGKSESYLSEYVTGIDRGIKKAVVFSLGELDATKEQKRRQRNHDKHLKQLQRKLTRQKKGSNRQRRTKQRFARKHEQIANIRNDVCHKISRSLVDSKCKVFVFEDLKTKNMTKSAKGTKESPGKMVTQKSGLNRSILDVGWHKIETYTKYKAYQAGKAVFKLSAYQTSQACAACGHTHPENRKSQSEFLCLRCNHTDNADYNAAEVIKQRAIDLIKDSGTELTKKGVLRPNRLSDSRGKVRRSSASENANANEASKKKMGLQRQAA